MQTEFSSIDELMAMLLKVSKESATYQKIALYIEKNYLRVIFMTASELAEQMKVSQGSVSRFFMAMGYQGYNGFLRNLQQIVTKQLTAPQRLQYSKEKHDPMGSAIEAEIANLEAVVPLLKEAGSQRIMEAIASQKPLVLLSARMSATLLPYMSYILQKLRNDVEVVTPDRQEWGTLSLRNPEDVNILVVAYPRYANELLKQCQRLHDKGFNLLVITDSRLSPFASMASAAAFTPITTASLFDIYSTPMAYINLLLREAAKNIKGLDDRIEAIEELEKKDNVYFNP
ncbi:MAG: MurR/RpiR family transcriptional regulator [Anaerovibrio sp.]|nr:MurR/RpiR family transcriptional regulator [Selenomonadaceae bacterium]MDY6054010.1 MurR/RpiR family transcriptional regulator [Anaerovibrio sp.]